MAPFVSDRAKFMGSVAESRRIHWEGHCHFRSACGEVEMVARLQVGEVFIQACSELRLNNQTVRATQANLHCSRKVAWVSSSQIELARAKPAGRQILGVETVDGLEIRARVNSIIELLCEIHDACAT